MLTILDCLQLHTQRIRDRYSYNHITYQLVMEGESVRSYASWLLLLKSYFLYLFQSFLRHNIPQWWSRAVILGTPSCTIPSTTCTLTTHVTHLLKMLVSSTATDWHCIGREADRLVVLLADCYGCSPSYWEYGRQVCLMEHWRICQVLSCN